MNEIVLHRATHKNFMSYGNNLNEFTFPEGLLWLSADNGSGKSTEIEVINFAFYGDSYRGGNRNDLRNTLNTEGTLEVMVEFARINGDLNEEYRITRSITPKGTMKFEVERLEDGAWVMLNKRAGFTQKDFEDNILCFNKTLFKNTIAVNTQESIPFIDMPAQDRRKLTESIAMISMDKWKKENGSRSSAAHSDFDIASNDMSRLGNEIAELDKIIEKMKEEKAANIQMLESQLTEKLNEQSIQSAKVQNLYDALNAKIGKINALNDVIANEPNIDASLATLRKANTAIEVLKGLKINLEKAKEQYNSLLSQYNEMGMDALKGQIAKLEDDIKSHNSTIEQHRNAITQYNDTINSINGNINAVKLEIGKIDYQISVNTDRMTELAAKGTSIEATPTAFHPGDPCPTCGKLYTEDDIEAHQKAEAARIEKLKEEWRTEYKNLRAQNNVLTESKNKWSEEWSKFDANISDIKMNKITAEEMSIAEINAKICDINQQISVLNGQIDEIQTFYVNEVAPAAGFVTNTERQIAIAEGDIAAAGVSISEFAIAEENLLSSKKAITDARNEWQVLNDEYNADNVVYGTENGILSGINSEVSRLNAEIAKAKDAAASDALAITEDRRKTAQQDYAIAENRMHTASDTIAICDYIAKLCSDDGMKKMVFSLFIPAFNAAVQKNIIRTGLPFTITFDETMAYTFTSAPGYAPTYVMLSQGQKRKVGFAITMAFRDFVSLVGNFKINFLSLDEVLDISTDNNAMRDMLDIVKDMVQDIGCVMVVTHRGDVVADKFDNKITVEYDGTYSRLGDVVKL